MTTSSSRWTLGLVFALLCPLHLSGAMPLQILTQPTNQTVVVGTTARFSVTAVGSWLLHYQWQRNGTNLPGKTSPILILTNVQPSQAGLYSVMVTSRSSSVTSSHATLTVTGAPTIVTQPAGCTNAVGTTASFSVRARGAASLSYRWRKNGTDLTDGGDVSGAASTNLVLSNVQDTDAASYSVVVTNIVGSITSTPAILVVFAPPIITLQPADQTVLAGRTASFGVQATDALPRSYQWRHNGTNLAGATNTTLTLPDVQPGQAGIYAVLVANPYVSIPSSNATLTVPPLTILAQPMSQVVLAGGSAGFSVTADSTVPLDYQWQHNGTNLAGETNPALELSDIQEAQAGTYSVWLTNSYGSLRSSNAVLTVLTSSTVIHNEPELQAAAAAGGAYTFDYEGVMPLSQTLNMTKPTILDGTGHTVIISGSNTLRLISVNTNAPVSFINLTLANGRAQGAHGRNGPDGQPGLGGAIYNNGGVVALIGCMVVSNAAVGGSCVEEDYPNTGGAGGPGRGGALCSLSGNLYITNCHFFANAATGGTGGGQYHRGFYYDPHLGGDAGGGAIYCQNGALTVMNSAFACQAAQGGNGGLWSGALPGPGGSAFGGAISASNVAVNLFGSTFTSNLVAVGVWNCMDNAGSGQGGAVFVTGGIGNCTSCIFATNSASAVYLSDLGCGVAQGGAIWNQAALLISQSGFQGNAVTSQGAGTLFSYALAEASGGAIFNSNTLALSSSMFANNSSEGTAGRGSSKGGMGRGGAICNPGILAATNCTLAENFAKGYPGSKVDALGGGLFNSGTATLVNLTFATNSVIGESSLALGSAICNSNGTVNLYYTILAGPASGTNCWGAMTDSGYNLCSDSSAGFSAADSLNNTDPLLGTLGDYGGPTWTLPLLPGSPAIDAVPAALAPDSDQRGYPRPYGSASDMGAFEWYPSP
jgi:hypothetical protein